MASRWRRKAAADVDLFPRQDNLQELRPAGEGGLALLNGGIDDLLHGDPALAQHGLPLLDHHGEGFEPGIGLADLVMVLQAITDIWAWRVWGYQEMVSRASAQTGNSAAVTIMANTTTHVLRVSEATRAAATRANESHAVAARVIYGTLPHSPGVLPLSYGIETLPGVDQQLEKADVRLAATLNAVLPR